MFPWGSKAAMLKSICICLVCIQLFFTLKSPAHRVLESRPKIHTYCDNPLDPLLSFWKHEWREAGWDPIVLTKEDAKKNIAYIELKGLFPDDHKRNSLKSMQWLAISTAGGGWLTELNVFPLRDFRNLECQDALSIWENVVPSLVSGSALEFQRGALELAKSLEQSGEQSDIVELVRMARRGEDDFSRHIRKVQSISRSKANEALPKNDCLDGKIAVHFTFEDTQTIRQWLSRWNAGRCSNLPKSKTNAMAIARRATVRRGPFNPAINNGMNPSMVLPNQDALFRDRHLKSQQQEQQPQRLRNGPARMDPRVRGLYIRRPLSDSTGLPMMLHPKPLAVDTWANSIRPVAQNYVPNSGGTGPYKNQDGRRFLLDPRILAQAAYPMPGVQGPQRQVHGQIAQDERAVMFKEQKKRSRHNQERTHKQAEIMEKFLSGDEKS